MNSLPLTSKAFTPPDDRNILPTLVSEALMLSVWWAP